MDVTYKTLEEDPAAYIISLYDAVKMWRLPYEDRWKRYYKLYRNWRDSGNTAFKSNIFVPYIFSIVESVVPKMLGTIFNVRPIISVIPRKGAAEDMSKLLETLLEYQLDEDQLELFTKVLEFFKECSIYGSSFCKVIPKFNSDEAASFNYIDVEPIDLFHVFPDYRAKSIRRMKYIMQLEYADYDELLKLEEQGFYKNVKDLIGYCESQQTVDAYKKERLTDIGILEDYGFDSSRKTIELIEYWDREKMYIIAAKKFVIKEEENPLGGLLPFIMSRYVPVQHELYGIGIPEIAESLQEELNSVRNQRMDNVNLILNRMFVVNKYADIDFDSLISYPGNVILTNDVNAVVPLKTDDITKAAYMEEDIIKKDIDNATGEWEYSRGATPPRRETATGIVRLQQASNIRFDTVVKMLEFTVLRSIAKMFLWLDFHFLEPKEFARIVGAEEFVKYNGQLFYEQDIDEVLKMYNFQPMGSSTTAVKEVRVQQLMQAYQMFNMDPMINQVVLRRMVLEALDVKNINRLLIEQPAQAQEQAMPPGPPGVPPPGAGGPPAGGPPPPMPPAPPTPGQAPQSAEAAMAEMMRIQGGGLIQKGAQNPMAPQLPQ